MYDLTCLPLDTPVLDGGNNFPKVRREKRRGSIFADRRIPGPNASHIELSALAGGHGNLCVVATTSIDLRWRGAEVRTYFAVPARLAWRPTVVRLEDNYRTCESDLDFANRLIAFQTTRHEKVLRAARPAVWRRHRANADEIDEAVKIVADIKLRQKSCIQRRDIAVLCRTERAAAAVRKWSCGARNCPYVLIGRAVVLRSARGERHFGVLARAGQSARRAVAPADYQYAAARHRASTVKTLLEQAVQQGKPMWDILTAPPRNARCRPACE